MTGRRGGKTTVCALLAIHALLHGQRVLEAAPTADQTDAFWNIIKRLLAPLTRQRLVRKDETRRVIEAKWNNGVIRCKTAWNADTLRGDYADVLILDEFSIMNPSVWYEVGAPMLLDNDGIAVFIFTPKRKNHAYELYAKALADDTGRWQVTHFTSYDNPHLSPEALQEIASDMTQDMFRQEIMAEFLDNEGAVFRHLDRVLTGSPEPPFAHQGHNIVMGIDWGKHHDYTAVSVFCVDCHKEVELLRFRGNYIDQISRIRDIFARWPVTVALGESNAMGEPILEALNAYMLPVIGYHVNAVTKSSLINNLVLACDAASFTLLDDPIARLEMEAYEYKTTPSGRSQYNAPSGIHDDTVIARALAWQAATQAGPLLLW